MCSPCGPVGGQSTPLYQTACDPNFYGILCDPETGLWSAGSSGIMRSRFPSALEALAALGPPPKTQVPSRTSRTAGSNIGKRCCQVLEQDGGCYGCDLPAGHEGAHGNGEPRATKAGRATSSSSSVAALAASASREVSPATGAKQRFEQCDEATLASLADSPAGLTEPQRTAVRGAVVALQISDKHRQLSSGRQGEVAVRAISAYVAYAAGHFSSQDKAASACGSSQTQTALYRRRLAEIGWTYPETDAVSTTSSSGSPSNSSSVASISASPAIPSEGNARAKWRASLAASAAASSAASSSSASSPAFVSQSGARTPRATSLLSASASSASLATAAASGASSSIDAGEEPTRRSVRATAGSGPVRLGENDGWGKGAAGLWVSHILKKKSGRQGGSSKAAAPQGSSNPHEVRPIMRGVTAAGAAQQQRLLFQQQQRQQEREARRRQMEKLARSDPEAAAQLQAVDEIERDSDRLHSMSYDELVAEKREWLESAPLHPTVEAWGTDWTPRIAAALRGRIVRKRYVMSLATVLSESVTSIAHATNFGRVVGCADHWFQVLYEDGYNEALSWHDLSRVLVPHASRDLELAALEQEETEGLVRASRRPKRKRDMNVECEAYLPRQGCHHSLPPDKVACHLHEALRLSGLVENDPGPEKSD